MQDVFATCLMSRSPCTRRNHSDRFSLFETYPRLALCVTRILYSETTELVLIETGGEILELTLADFFLELAGDPELKRKFVANPREVLTERGVSVPEGVNLKVLEDTETVRHIVVPYLRATEKHTPQELEKRLSKIILPP